MQEFKRLLRYVRPHRFSFIAAMVAMVFVAVFETAIGFLLVPIIGQFTPNCPDASTEVLSFWRFIPEKPWYNAWAAISILLVSFTIAKGIAEYFSSYLMARIGQLAVLDLRSELYGHLIDQPASFFQKHRTNFLVSRLVVSCSAIEQGVTANRRDVRRDSVMLSFYLGAAFYLSWKLMLGAMIIAPIVAYLTSRFSKALRRFADVTFEGNKLLNDAAQEALSNQAIVKAYGRGA